MFTCCTNGTQWESNVELIIAGLGVVIRNSRGRVVAVAVQNVPFRSTVASMEAEAVLFGIETAQQVDYCRKESKTEIEWIIAEIQTKLRIQSQASIQFAPRGCNLAAHHIAKKVLDVENQCIWLENFSVHVSLLLSKFC